MYNRRESYGKRTIRWCGDITNAVRTVAGNYETALNNLLTDASNESMDISAQP